jgi:hypothetical protein
MSEDGKSPYDFLSRKKGSREKASTKPSMNEEERILHDKEEKTVAPGVLSSRPMGSVGMAVTVGMATKFMRQKVEVHVWESRPVSLDHRDRAKVKSEMAGDLMIEAGDRLDEVIQTFFPELLEAMKDDAD